ncbi:MAG: AAA family ATPase [Candidatus Pacebacteria bacterium]|nr:AAA family ATPase [Candidatus Paceibacterota bacterium]
MTAQDMLYSVDDIRRLSDAQTKALIPAEMKEEALEWRNKILKGEAETTDEEYIKFNGRMKAIVELSEVAKDLDYSNYIDLGQLGEAIYQSGKGRKVYLLIDEIEKGREELMNGILDEIENLVFTINETGEVIKGNKRNLRIIITTNPEDSDKIPASFRRRSLYHFMSSPERADLAKIVELNFPEIRGELLGYALDVFYRYKSHPDIEKSPSTPELLAWIRVLSENGGDIPEGIPYKEVLLKYKEDRDLDIGIERAKDNNKETPHEMPIAFYKALQGHQVFKMDGLINDPNKDPTQFGELYAELEGAGVNFNTPVFKEEVHENRYNDDDDIETVLERPFVLIGPGIQSLGNGCFAIEKGALAGIDKKDIFSHEIKVIPESVDFERIQSKNQEFTTGTISYEGEDVLAYKRNSDGRTAFYSKIGESRESRMFN